MQSRKVSGPAGGTLSLSEIGETAAPHGRELMQHGFTVEEVVHDYGDLCQAITDLAFEHGAPHRGRRVPHLNRCLDNAIASAVTEFGYQRDFVVADKQAEALNERLGYFAHELRNQLATATLALPSSRRQRRAVRRHRRRAGPQPGRPAQPDRSFPGRSADDRGPARRSTSCSRSPTSSPRSSCRRRWKRSSGLRADRVGRGSGPGGRM